MPVRFTIASVMATVLGLGVALAVLRYPSPLWASLLFTVALALPLAAILHALAHRGRRRLPSIGFALFGLVFLSVSFDLPNSAVTLRGSYPPPDAIITRALADLSPYLNPEVAALASFVPGGAAMERRYAYLSCCASLGSIAFALIGGLWGRLLVRTSHRDRTGP